MDPKNSKSKEGEVQAPLTLAPLKAGDLEQHKQGMTFICTKCGYGAHPHKLH